MTTLRSIKSIGWSPSRLALLLISLVFACFTLPERAHAVSPAPDGGYPNGNTAEGQNALHSLTSGGYNTAIGFLSLYSDTQGTFNTAIGAGTLLANTGDDNTATGGAALLNNTTGFNNTANGANALSNNTTGVDNTATGHAALYANTTGAHNVANGDAALLLNTTGNDNTAIGYEALFNNATGPSNTAIGYQALLENTTGSENTANGYQALYSNTTGGLNVANGAYALYANTTGPYNTANGFGALFSNTSGDHNTAVGLDALFNNTNGYENIALGDHAGFNQTTGDNNIYIGWGMQGEAGETNHCYIGSIFGGAVPGGVTVIVDAGGHLGTVASSQRFKDQIKPMDKASEAIFALKPVTFRYKKELDPKSIPQFGLVAEEVEKVNPDLVVRDKEGKTYSVRYEQVNAMLLNEFLKEHKTVQEQGATIAELKKEIAALTAGLQKVSAQLAAASPSGGGLEASKPASQVALNNP